MLDKLMPCVVLFFTQRTYVFEVNMMNREFLNFARWLRSFRYSKVVCQRMNGVANPRTYSEAVTCDYSNMLALRGGEKRDKQLNNITHVEFSENSVDGVHEAVVISQNRKYVLQFS